MGFVKRASRVFRYSGTEPKVQPMPIPEPVRKEAPVKEREKVPAGR